MLIVLQILVDGPSKEKTPIPRHEAALANTILTHIVLEKLPRAIGTGPLAKAWEKLEIDSKWRDSSWAKARAQREKRRNLTDFERFKVMKLRKQVSWNIEPRGHYCYVMPCHTRLLLWAGSQAARLSGVLENRLILLCSNDSRSEELTQESASPRNRGLILGNCLMASNCGLCMKHCESRPLSNNINIRRSLKDFV